MSPPTKTSWMIDFAWPDCRFWTADPLGENPLFGKVRPFQVGGFDGAIAAIEAGCSRAGGETIESEKSMMYLTMLRQKRQGVSRT